MKAQQFNALLRILDGEQQLLQRTDQKAFTMLSTLGVFMVFFIVHFTKMQLDTLVFLLVVVYFPAAMAALYFLILVIVPRIRSAPVDAGDPGKRRSISPTFFGGISQFSSSAHYAEYLKEITQDEDQLYDMFAAQVFALGRINSDKDENIRKGMFFMVLALTSELLIIMTLAYRSALDNLSDQLPYYLATVVVLFSVAVVVARKRLFSR